MGFKFSIVVPTFPRGICCSLPVPTGTFPSLRPIVLPDAFAAAIRQAAAADAESAEGE